MTDHIFKEHNIILFTETWSNKQTEHEVQGLNIMLYTEGKERTLLEGIQEGGVLVIYITKYRKNYVKCLKTVKDDILWIYITGEVFASDEDLYLCLCYNTPIGSSREAMDDGISIFDRILNILYM